MYTRFSLSNDNKSPLFCDCFATDKVDTLKSYFMGILKRDVTAVSIYPNNSNM